MFCAGLFSIADLLSSLPSRAFCAALTSSSSHKSKCKEGGGLRRAIAKSGDGRVQATFVQYGVAGQFSTSVAHSCTIRNLRLLCLEFGISRLGGHFGDRSISNAFGSISQTVGHDSRDFYACPVDSFRGWNYLGWSFVFL